MSEFNITKEEALKLLPEGDSIHTFRNPRGMLVGCDWSRDEILKAIDKHGVQMAGDQAKAMNHGLALNDGSWLFIETKS